MNITLTGATGFLGRYLINALQSNPGFKLTAVVRQTTEISGIRIIPVQGVDAVTDYSSWLKGQDVVIHAAARAHIMRDEVDDPLVEYRKVNVSGSENLARQAAAAGVKRFVFVSSVKACGESTTHSNQYIENMSPTPEDAYGCSKYEAEQILKQVAADTGMELVIIRPPLIYGAGVKANFLSLLRIAGSPFPLPFGRIFNRRSMVYVRNLVDFIVCCIDHPAAANQTFFVSDGEDVSLRQLVTEIRLAMGKSPALFPVPVALFRLLGKLTGKSGVVDRLVGDLQVDSSKARNLLGWTPPYTFSQGIAETVNDFKKKE